MFCVRCSQRRWWPRDFPNTTYAVCYACAAATDVEERRSIEKRSTIFFYVLAVGGVLAVIATGVAFALC